MSTLHSWTSTCETQSVLTPYSSLRRQKLRGPSYEFLMHHATALLLAVLAYYYQAFLYFAPGFMGVPELSSLPFDCMLPPSFPRRSKAPPRVRKTV